MTDLELQKKRFEFSVKLCAAVKKHKCLHDRTALQKNSPQCRLAWEEVAKECNESIRACKSRWRDLQKSFFQGIKRRGNHYYLHSHMEFLLSEKEKLRVNRKKEKSLAINDETSSNNSLQQSLDEDLTQQETLMDTINIDEEDDEGKGGGGVEENTNDGVERDDDSDSHTTSADESNEFNTSHEQVTGNKGSIFIIDEIGQEVDEDSKRLTYKRACKRGLGAEMLNDEIDEQQEPVEKRKRRSAAGKLINNDETKNPSVRADKIKINKANIAIDNNLNKSEDKTKTYKSSYTNQMIDRSTSTEKTLLDVATQYDTESTQYDHIFLESIKSQLQLMNARQKMNFKRRIYEAFLEVFDDNTDFPKGGDVLKLPTKVPTKTVNTTVGELRLMRELVALVQAAKNTPEIINNKEKVKTVNSPPTPVKTTPLTNAKNSSVSSPLSLSPSLDDDDDLQFSLDNIDEEDDIQLPKTWDEIKQKINDDNNKQQQQQQTATLIQKTPQINEENVMGLPRRVLQKVVRVAGSSGSTIVARDGDKKRIYRIYPKTTTPNSLPIAANKTVNNAGTYFVNPNRNTTESPSTSANKTVTGVSNNITIRNVSNKPKTPGAETLTNNSNNTQQTSSPMAANKSPAINNQTVFQNVHPANRILSSSTGYFKIVPTTKNLSSPLNKPMSNTSTSSAPTSNTITRVLATKSPMLPPNIPQKRQVQVRSHIGSQMLAQRRYSICGPMPSDKLIGTPTPRGFVVNQPIEKASLSQIQISEPVSLNTKAKSSQPPQASLNTQSNSNNLNSSTNKPAATSTSTSLATPKSNDPQQDIKPMKSLNLQDSNNTKHEPTEEIPILETAGTIGADNLDPLFVKPPQIKSEPLDN